MIETDSSFDHSDEESLEEDLNEQVENRFELVAVEIGAPFIEFDSDQVQPALPNEQDNQDRIEEEVSLDDEEYDRCSWSDVLALSKRDDSAGDLNLFCRNFFNEGHVTNFSCADLSIVSTLIFCLNNLFIYKWITVVLS